LAVTEIITGLSAGMLKTDTVIYYPDIHFPDTKLSG